MSKKKFYSMKKLKNLSPVLFFMKKEKVSITVQIAGISYLAQKQSLIVELAGPHSQRHYLELLKLKSTFLLE